MRRMYSEKQIKKIAGLYKHELSIQCSKDGEFVHDTYEDDFYLIFYSIDKTPLITEWIQNNDDKDIISEPEDIIKIISPLLKEDDGTVYPYTIRLQFISGSANEDNNLINIAINIYSNEETYTMDFGLIYNDIQCDSVRVFDRVSLA